MPEAAMHRCPGGCGRLVRRGRCAACSVQQDASRGTVTARGYGYAWAQFRPRFIAMLVHAGVTPCCGAALATGPKTSDSQCRTEGRINGAKLHLDHEPKLQLDERTQAAKVCDPNRIQLLCSSCHALKTTAEQWARLDAPAWAKHDGPRFEPILPAKGVGGQNLPWIEPK